MRFKTLIILALSLIITTAGCGAGGGSVLSYRDHDASFSAVFSTSLSPDGIICQGTKSGDRVTLTITSPARSSGITAEYDRSSLILSVGDTAIPLSGAVSENLTDLFDLLFYIPQEQWTAHRSDDGSNTILVCQSGQVELGSDNLPVSVMTDSGKTVIIKDYAFSDQNN